jgi:hypothetical protein
LPDQPIVINEHNVRQCFHEAEGIYSLPHLQQNSLIGHIIRQVRDNRAKRLDAAGGRAYHNDVMTVHELFMKNSLHFVKVSGE